MQYPSFWVCLKSPHGFGRIIAEVRLCSSQSILSGAAWCGHPNTVDINFNPLIKVETAGLLHCKLILYPFILVVSVGETSFTFLKTFLYIVQCNSTLHV